MGTDDRGDLSPPTFKNTLTLITLESGINVGVIKKKKTLKNDGNALIDVKMN